MASNLLLLLLFFNAGLILTSLPSTTPATPNHLMQSEFMPVGYTFTYGEYKFAMQADCNAYFSNKTLTIWQTNLNYDGARNRCRLVILSNCNIVILSDFLGTVLWGSDTQQDVDTACYIEVTEHLILYKADRTMLWVDGQKVGALNNVGANSRV
ncbi:lectin-like [Phalaenopsis equestris]|uniref:lectin-like n=1 Tax=Phalaenopsis equestris TaxID=78828 RepID=UPI0009E50B9E|nr:lectin-like [Phalaenopsis equestris]